MPEISRFFGIVIAMFYKDHPPPHFHVRYDSQRANIDIGTFAVLEGALGLVVQWAAQHQHELRANWDRARRRTPLRPIQPFGVKPCSRMSSR